MKIEDFAVEEYTLNDVTVTGYCVTTTDDQGKEVVLSQCMKDGTLGVGLAMARMAKEMHTIPTINFRYMMLKQGVKLEQKGIRLTAKTPPCSAIIKNEYGVKKGLSKAKTAICFDLLLSLAALYLEKITEEAIIDVAFECLSEEWV